MGILKEKKDDWTETLFKGYYYDEQSDEEVVDGWYLFYKPYTAKIDFTKNGVFHMHERNTFRDNAYFDDSTTSFTNTIQHDRI